MKYLKKISLFSAIFALMLTFTLSTTHAQDTTEVPQPEPETYLVKGKVVDAQTTNVVSDAEVSIVGTNISTISDAEGKFKLENLPVGTHTIKVELDGYQSWEKELNLKADTELQIELKPEAEK